MPEVLGESDRTYVRRGGSVRLSWYFGVRMRDKTKGNDEYRQEMKKVPALSYRTM